MIPAVLLPYVWRIGAVFALVLACWIGVKVHDHRIVAAEREHAQAQLVKATAAAIEAKARGEAALQSRFNRIQGDEDAKLHNLSASLSAARRLLRDRASRPAAMPAAAPVAATCTGAGLYRQDAEFLVGEAARADRLRIQLDDCEARYNQAREVINHVQ